MSSQRGPEPQIVTCPTCSTQIEIDGRCTHQHNQLRCVETAGHDGWHWADVGSVASVVIWTGVTSRRNCPAHLSLTRWCEKLPTHTGPHRNRGTTWDEELVEP